MMQQNEFELSDDSDEEFEKDRRRDKRRQHHYSSTLKNNQKSSNSNIDHGRRQRSNFRSDFDPPPSFKRTVAAIPKSRFAQIQGLVRLETAIVCTVLYTSLHFMLHYTYTETVNNVSPQISPDPTENYRTLANLYSSDGLHGVPFLWKQEGGPSPLEDILYQCLCAEKMDGASMGLSTVCMFLQLKS